MDEAVYHVPVLLKACVDGLQVKPDGVYADLTFGGGGHSREILSHLGGADICMVSTKMQTHCAMQFPMDVSLSCAAISVI